MKTKARRRVRSYEGVACPHCNKSLLPHQLASGPGRCLYCRKPFEAIHFTAPVRKPLVQTQTLDGPHTGMACASHERNAAVANCGRCGNFICNLCRIDADEQILCPPCFERMAAEGALPSVQTRFTSYATLARTLAILGLLLFYFGALFGPLVLYFSVKALRQRERGDIRSLLSIIIVMLLGVLQLTGGTVLLIWIIWSVALGGG